MLQSCYRVEILLRVVLPVNFKCASSRHSNFLCPYNWMFVCLFECLRKSCKMAKDRSSLVRLRKREGLNIRPCLFLIDHVSSWSRSPLTSPDCYRCPSLYCLAWVFQNLPAPHKHYGVFDVFADFQSFFQPENLGFALSNVHRWQISTSR